MHAQQWSCDVCTFKQAANAPRCAICQNVNQFIVVPSQSDILSNRKRRIDNQQHGIRQRLRMESSNHDIQIPISLQVHKWAVTDGKKWIIHQFPLSINYRHATVNDVIKKSIKHINKKLGPAKHRLYLGISANEDEKIKMCVTKFMKGMTLNQRKVISTNEDIEQFIDKNSDKIFKSVALKTFKFKNIIQTGFILKCGVIPYQQNIFLTEITCPHLLSSQNKRNILNCPIYKMMTQQSLYSEQNLNHLLQHTHFENDNDKKECPKKEQCKFYKRMISGKYGIKNRCHCKLYRHPPRFDRIALKKDIHPFVYMDIDNKKQHKRNMLTIYNPCEDCKVTTEKEKEEYLLNKLIEEVVYNGYKKDLCLSGVNQENDIKNDHYTLMKIVKEKMNDPRHKRLGFPLYDHHILALLVYTGGDCNYDLCAAQRNGNYKKWKVLDWCLNSAIKRLNFWDGG
eukprot:187200_1